MAPTLATPRITNLWTTQDGVAHCVTSCGAQLAMDIRTNRLGDFYADTPCCGARHIHPRGAHWSVTVCAACGHSVDMMDLGSPEDCLIAHDCDNPDQCAREAHTEMWRWLHR